LLAAKSETQPAYEQFKNLKPKLISKLVSVPVKDVYDLAAYKPRPASTPLYCNPEIL
jgi:hypothetical protein